MISMLFPMYVFTFLLTYFLHLIWMSRLDLAYKIKGLRWLIYPVSLLMPFLACVLVTFIRLTVTAIHRLTLTGDAPTEVSIHMEHTVNTYLFPLVLLVFWLVVFLKSSNR